MFSAQPGIIFAGTTAWILFAIYVYLHWTENRSKYFFLWTMAWGFFSLRFLAEYFLYVSYSPLLELIMNSLVILHAWLLLWGAREFLDNEVKPWPYLIGMALGVGWSVLAALFLDDRVLGRIPTFYISGIAHITTGYLFIQRSRHSRKKIFVGSLFIFWGLHKLDYPFTVQLLWFAPFGYWLGGLLALSIAFGTVMAAWEETKQELHRRFQEGITLLADLVDARDAYTARHSYRVSYFASLIAQEMGLSQEMVANVKIAGLIHDLGKLAIPDRILQKPSALSPEEYRLIQTHPVVGARILAKTRSFHKLTEPVKYHHERFDGRGYPEGLNGNEIPIEAAILSVSDAFEAMTSDRPYRSALPLKQVIEELKACRGSQFHPEAVDCLLKLLKDGRIEPFAPLGQSLLELGVAREPC